MNSIFWKWYYKDRRSSTARSVRMSLCLSVCLSQSQDVLVNRFIDSPILYRSYRFLFYLFFSYFWMISHTIFFMKNQYLTENFLLNLYKINKNISFTKITFEIIIVELIIGNQKWLWKKKALKISNLNFATLFWYPPPPPSPKFHIFDLYFPQFLCYFAIQNNF